MWFNQRIGGVIWRVTFTQLRKEIEDRRREVERGEYLTHEEFWEDI